MRHQAKKSSKPFLIVSILLIVFLFLFSIHTFLNYLQNRASILETVVLAVEFEIRDTVGSDLNTTALTFGVIPAGSSSTRNILVHNRYDHPITLSFLAHKDIVSYLSIDAVSQVEPNETAVIGVTLYLPEEIEHKAVSSWLKILIKKA